MVSSAPMSYAINNHWWSTSAITILGAANARAADMVTMPMGPAPKIETLLSGLISTRLQSWTPTLSGSHMAPCPFFQTRIIWCS
ncbi:hypothetical protein HanXRQr2_Chr09g0372451 [Helianthus annuus]|uniref:Uncharacterized protein n=1 Tax=Helianthus annuus TaxID=4232 RepID=A0A9K3I3B0_HELAN|nr:hypothetical protein HanXRQr2_Chr09g0372451 [Helianthus annuus]